jgi:hypothetical protein
MNGQSDELKAAPGGGRGTAPHVAFIAVGLLGLAFGTFVQFVSSEARVSPALVAAFFFVQTVSQALLLAGLIGVILARYFSVPPRD